MDEYILYMYHITYTCNHKLSTYRIHGLQQDMTSEIYHGNFEMHSLFVNVFKIFCLVIVLMDNGTPNQMR